MGLNWESRVKISGNHLEYGVLGHYRAAVRMSIVALQAANSRLFELRNSSDSNLIIPTKINVQWLQTAAHTAAIEDSLDMFKVTGFTAVDSVNTVTPTISVKKTSGMAAAPGSAEIRHVTVAGAAAGMTGGTLTKDGSALAQLPQWLLLAQPTGGVVQPAIGEFIDDRNGGHPLVLAKNEGFIIENRVLLGAAAGSSVYIDVSWAEVNDYR